MTLPIRIAPKVLSWASELEPETAAQAERLSRLPFIHEHVALMPDAHLGKGATVGSVIATRGAVVPAAVGVDLGCGMLAVQTTLTRSQVTRQDLTSVLDELKANVPAGVGQGHATAHKEATTAVDDLVATHETRGRAGDAPRLDRRLQPGKELHQLAIAQFGTLGSGNHFLEVCADQDDQLWAVVHSGSRGVGNRLAMGHIKDAHQTTKKWFITLEDPDLAYIPEGTEHFGRYLADVRWAQDYAWANREAMMRRALSALLEITPFETTATVHCHHNYIEREHHMGQNLWITRKGAVYAGPGSLSVLPGSMGTDTYIVAGLANPASFHSAPHGAGRRLSRTRARKELTLESMQDLMADRVWLDDSADALLDEHPAAYKDVTQVLADAATLVTPVHTLTPILNYKGL